MEGWAQLAAAAQKGSVTRPQARGEEILPCGRGWDAALPLQGGSALTQPWGPASWPNHCSISLCSLTDTEPPWLPVTSPPQLMALDTQAPRQRRQPSPQSARSLALLAGAGTSPPGARPPHAGWVQAVGCSGPQYFYPLRVCVSHSFVSLQY